MSKILIENWKFPQAINKKLSELKKKEAGGSGGGSPPPRVPRPPRAPDAREAAPPFPSCKIIIFRPADLRQ